MFNAKNLIAILLAMGVMSASARTLHYGEESVELTDTKNTSPALYVKFDNGETVYGALYSMTAPKNTLRIEYDNTEYWVGKWCDGGKYIKSGSAQCSDCGYGYYCTGGDARDVCLGGIIGCNTKTESRDRTADASLLNRPLTLDEVNEYVPVTDASDWEKIDAAIYENKFSNTVYGDEYANDPSFGNSGTIPMGTYLFVVRVNSAGCGGEIDPLSGQAGAYSAYIGVFDKPVGYKFLRGFNMIYIYLDTQSSTFTSWDIRIPGNSASKVTAYCRNEFWVNVTDMNSIPTNTLAIYRLK